MIDSRSQLLLLDQDSNTTSTAIIIITALLLVTSFSRKVWFRLVECAKHMSHLPLHSHLLAPPLLLTPSPSSPNLSSLCPQLSRCSPAPSLTMHPIHAQSYSTSKVDLLSLIIDHLSNLASFQFFRFLRI
jgi:hypothetical protein